MDISIKTILEYINKRWWIIVLCTFLGFLVSYLSAVFIVPKVYSSSVILSYDGTGDVEEKRIKINTSVTVIDSNEYLDRLSNFLDERYLDDSGVFEGTSKTLTKSYGESVLKNMINVTGDRSNLMLKIVVEANNSTDAFLIAEAVRSEEMLLQLVSLAGISKTSFQSMNVINTPRENHDPIRPSVLMYSIMGCFLGILAGFIVSFAFEKLDVRIKGEEDLLSKYNLPVLGIIPNFPLNEEEING